MGTEYFEKWEPVGGIHTPVARALIKEDHDGLVVTLIFSEIVDGLDSDLQIYFGRVPAYTVHEEFVHPFMIYDIEPPPRLNGRWERYYFPILLVKNSVWVGSFSDSQLINYPECIHYRLITLDKTVDVLCNEAPKVSWIKTSG